VGGEALVKKVRDDPSAGQDQWNKNSPVQLPKLLDSKNANLILS